MSSVPLRRRNGRSPAPTALIRASVPVPTDTDNRQKSTVTPYLRHGGPFPFETFLFPSVFPYRRNMHSLSRLCYGSTSRDRKPREFLHAETDVQIVCFINLA